MALNTGLNALNQKPINQNGATLNTSQMVQGAFGMPVSTTGQTSPIAQNTIASSPALSAMAGTTRNPTTPPPAPAPGAAPAAASPAAPRTDLVTPTKVDQSGANAWTDKALADSDKAFGYIQANNANTMSALMRRNASNAALSGFSVGGGSYLAGQRSAAVAGINAANQAALGWLNQRQGIYGQAAGLASNAASQNAASANQGSMFNAGREGSIADQKTAAQSTQNANQTVGSVDQIDADFKYLFDKHNFVDGAGRYNSLLTAYKNSLTTGNAQEQAAAYQALMAFITPIQQAREEWVRTGGQDKNGDFKDWYKAHGGA